MIDSPRKRAMGCLVHVVWGVLAVGGLLHCAPSPRGAWDWAFRLMALPTWMIMLLAWGLLWEFKVQRLLWPVAAPSEVQAWAYPMGGLLGFVLWFVLR